MSSEIQESLSSSSTLMEQLPTDVVVTIIEMLQPDLRSIYNFCCSCKTIYHRIPMFLCQCKMPESSSTTNNDNNAITNSTNNPQSTTSINENTTTNDSSDPLLLAQSIWKNLYKQRWWKSTTTAETDYYSMIDKKNRTMVYYRKQYKFRLEEDTNAVGLLAGLVYGMIDIGYKDAILNRNTSSFFREPEIGYDIWCKLLGDTPDRTIINDRNNLRELLITIVQTSDISSTLPASTENQQQKVDDTVWWIRRIRRRFDNSQTNYSNVREEDPIVPYELTKFVAIHLLNDINYYEVLSEWMDYWIFLNDCEDAYSDDEDEEEDSYNVLQDGTILIARFVDSCYDHSFTSGTGALLDESKSVIEPALDKMATELQSKINDLESSSSSQNRTDTHRILGIVTVLTQYIFTDLGIAGIDNDYYNVTNTSIKSLLFEKRGHPLTFVILYKLLLNRVNIRTDIIDIAGHVLLELPTTPRWFVDVFEHGKLVSLTECQAMVDEQDEDFWETTDDDRSVPGPMEKLSTAALVRRMVQSLQRSCSITLSHDENQDRYEQNEVRLFRLRTFDTWSRQTAIIYFDDEPTSYLSKEYFLQTLIKSTMPTFNPHMFRRNTTTTTADNQQNE